MQHHRIEDEPERVEMILWAFAVALAQLAALAVEDPAGQGAAGFGDVELGGDRPRVGFVLQERQHMEALVDPTVGDDRLAQ
jgi:hypothetical protein